MSIEPQSSCGGLHCNICHKILIDPDVWSFRHRDFEPLAMITCCGDCKRRIVAIVLENQRR